jgi:hypothetical protein
MVMETLKGEGWVVMKNRSGYLEVLGPGNVNNAYACRLCVAQAHEGNPDALAAILICSEDKFLQDLAVGRYP